MAASLLVKVDYQGDLRRFSAPLPLTLSNLTQTLRGVFGLADEAVPRLAYTDNDGDKITVTTDEDLTEAVACLPATATPSCLRLTLQDVHIPSSTSSASASSVLPTTPAAPPTPTSFAFCDVCSKQIAVTDVRFKCGDCANFDLCAVCEARDEHDPSHVLLKLKPQAQVRCGRLPTDKPVLANLKSASAPASTQPDAGIDLNSFLDSALREVRGQGGAPAATPAADPMQSLVTTAAQLASSIFAAPPAGGASQPAAPQPSPAGGAGSLGPLMNLASSFLASPAAQGAGKNLDLGSLLGSLLQAPPAGSAPAAGAGARPNLSQLLSGLAAAAAAETPSAQPASQPAVDSQTLQPSSIDPSEETNGEENYSSLRTILLDQGIPEQAVDDLIVASGGNLDEALDIWAVQNMN